MGKFFAGMKKNLSVKRRLYNMVAPHLIQLEQATYTGAIDNLKNSIASRQLNKKTFKFLQEFYNKSLINNKTFKQGYENYVGDKALYNRSVIYFPTLLEHRHYLDDDDLEFIDLTLIPLFEVLRQEALGSRAKTWSEMNE